MPNVVFVFAHQDDEFGALPWLEEEVASGATVHCVYLTDGASSVLAQTRDGESVAALQRLGIPSGNIAFLCDERGRVGDAKLIDELARSHSMIETHLKQVAPLVARIYAPAWEGGHPDHDAAHVIALAAAAGRNIIADTWQFALYNNYKIPRPLFRCLQQLPRNTPKRIIQYGLRKGWVMLNACWGYPSQRRTWIGLFAPSALSRLVIRRESVYQLAADECLRRPHNGALLYEYMFCTPYEHVHRNVKQFLVQAGII